MPLLARSALVPGLGPARVNVGYTAVLSFAGLGMIERGLAAAAVIPVYAVAIIVLRTFGGGLPDRLGPRRALTISAAVAGAGLALRGVPATERGAASGTFFAFFDVGVGLGGPALGVVAAVTGASGAVVAGAMASAASCAVLLPLSGRS